MRSVLWHLFLVCSHCFLFVLHLFLRHIFCLRFLFGLLVFLLLLVLANIWLRGSLNVGRSSRNTFQQTFAEHEMWVPFRKLHDMPPYQQKASKSYGCYGGHRKKPSQSGLTLLHDQHPLAKEQEHYIRTRIKENKFWKKQKWAAKHRQAVFRQGSLFNPLSLMGACSGVASCNQQIHKRMLERHSMQHGSSISTVLVNTDPYWKTDKYQLVRLQYTGFAV